MERAIYNHDISIAIHRKEGEYELRVKRSPKHTDIYHADDTLEMIDLSASFLRQDTFFRLNITSEAERYMGPQGKRILENIFGSHNRQITLQELIRVF